MLRGVVVADFVGIVRIVFSSDGSSLLSLSAVAVWRDVIDVAMWRGDFKTRGSTS